MPADRNGESTQESSRGDNFGEPWEHTNQGTSIHTAARELAAHHFDPETEEDEAAQIRFFDRIVACVNACAGMNDPAAEIAKLRGALGAWAEYVEHECDQEPEDCEHLPEMFELAKGLTCAVLVEPKP